MRMELAIPALIAAFLVSLFLTALMRLYLLRRGLLDVPNERSSHSAPVPRGGGASIVVVFLAAIAWFWRSHLLSDGFALAVIGGGLAVAAIGFLDDHFYVSNKMRVSVHFAAAGWALWHLGGMGPLQLGSRSLQLGWLGQAVGLVGLVWLVNLYNFMDGIDGIAGMEAVCVSGFGGLLLAWAGAESYAYAAWTLAAASFGFLVLNWPPARIFMGDVGSGFLGFVLGVCALSSARQHPQLAWSWLILLSAFVVDSTVTLARRAIGGARWYEAHCSHAYQHAAKRWGGHWKVTSAVAAINVVWLFPIAWGAFRYPEAAPLFAAVAAAPLFYITFRYDAGRERPRFASKGPQTRRQVPTAS